MKLYMLLFNFIEMNRKKLINSTHILNFLKAYLLNFLKFLILKRKLYSKIKNRKILQ